MQEGVLIVFITSLFLIFFHELGHVIAAKILSLQIQKISFRWKPYPSFFVQIKWTNNIRQSLIFLFAGNFVTILLFSIAYFTQLLTNKYIFIAFALQLLIETNPFYSDYVTAILIKRNQKSGQESPLNKNFYEKLHLSYLYTTKWYIHFVLWTIFILILLKNKL